MLKPLSLLKVGIILTAVLGHSPCWAQVTGIEGTNTPLVGNQFDIIGGQVSGANQFHSFSQFGLNPGQIANFVANPGIQNILGRVTGGNASIINGSIQVSGGNPNLYLMNPSGFLFGSGASLNVPGSFTATTASAIEIGNQQWFNAIGANNYVALTGTPGGLAFTMTQPGAIIIDRGNLIVTQGNSLSLVAGSISSSGSLSAPGGQLTIAVAPGSSLVRVSQPGSPLGLVFDSLSSVTNQPARGNFAIESIPRLLTLGNVTLPAPSPSDVGDISLSSSIVTSGRTVLQADGNIRTQAINTQGGDLLITSRGKSINTNGQDLNTTRGINNGGNIVLNAKTGISTGNLQSYSEITNVSATVGNGGDITLTASAGSINAGKVESYSSSVAPNGQAATSSNGGNIVFKALDDITVGDWMRSYSRAGSPNPRNIPVGNRNTGNAGEITLISQKGSVSTSLIEAYSSASGSAGSAGNGGSVTFLAPLGNITSGYIQTTAESTQSVSGNGGSINLFADTDRGNITIENTPTSIIHSFTNSSTGGKGGDISFSAAAINKSLTSRVLAGGGVGGIISFNATKGIFFTNVPSATESSIDTSNTVTLNGNVNGDVDLWISARGKAVTLNGNLGQTTPLRGLRTTGSSALQIAGSVNLADGVPQSYDTPVTLVGNTSFGNDRTRSVTFNQPVSIGNNSLTITAGNVDFKQPVSGPGNILIQPLPNQTIQIGNSSTQPYLNIPSGSRSGSVTISRPDNSNNVLFLGETQFNTPLNLRANTISHTNSTIRGTAPLTIEANQISVGNIINPGQSIVLNSQRNLTTGNLDASTPTAQSGSITLRSDQGSIVTGTLNSSGSIGNSTAILARTAVTTQSINTSGSQGGGGNLLIDPIGDVQTGSINTQGGNLGEGGDIRIVAGQLFRATETFTDRNNTLASISAAGGLGGGRIEIFHGGGSRNIRFNVGDATTNGTTGAITNGINSILPPRSFLGSFHIGDIRIITTNPQTPCDVSSCPTSKPNVPPRDQAKRDTQPFITYLPDSNHDAEFREYLGALPGILATPKNATPIDIQRKLRAIKDETNKAVKPAIVYLTFVSANASSNKTAWLQSLVDNDPQYQQVLWKFDSSGNAINYITEQQPQENQTPQDNDQLEIIILTTNDSIIRKRVPNATRGELKRLTKIFLDSVRNDNIAETKVKEDGNRLYEYLIAPVSAELNAQEINNLTFIADRGLRGIPFAALSKKSGQYLIEEYSVGLMPSFSLTDTRYTPLKNAKLLALNAFTENEDPSQKDNRPYAALGVNIITSEIWPSQQLSREEFTLNNLKLNRRSGQHGIVHLATHAKFNAKALHESSITFGNDSAISLDEVSQMQLNDPPTNLLVLIACETAIPDPSAELGFAGIAAKTGANSVIAGLWDVPEIGGFALMTKFYEQLRKEPIKAQALQKAQISIIKEQVKFDMPGILTGFDTNIPVKVLQNPDGTLKNGKTLPIINHPYYWAGFTLVGSPW